VYIIVCVCTQRCHSCVCGVCMPVCARAYILNMVCVHPMMLFLCVRCVCVCACVSIYHCVRAPNDAIPVSVHGCLCVCACKHINKGREQLSYTLIHLLCFHSCAQISCVNIVCRHHLCVHASACVRACLCVYAWVQALLTS
jgi:hypothetical protein